MRENQSGSWEPTQLFPCGEIEGMTSYKNICRYISQKIETGILIEGDRLPTIDQLARHFKVSPVTMRRAIGRMKEAGLVEAIRGSGVYILAKDRPTGLRSDPLPITVFMLQDHPGDAQVRNFFGETFSEIMLGVQQCVQQDARLQSSLVLLKEDHFSSPETLASVLPPVGSSKGGLFLWSGTTPAIAAQLERQVYFPIVYYDCLHLLEGCNTICIDLYKGARKAIGHLVEKGHQRIGMIGSTVRQNYQFRYQAWEDALQEEMFETDSRWCVDCGETILEIHQAGERILNIPVEERPTAVFCFNDLRALHLVDVAQSRGIRVPGDLSVIGFDASPSALESRLATVHLPYKQVGIHAMALLRSILEEDLEAPLSVTLSMALLEGQSV